MKRILIFCQHFAPAYKGGGPIQSLTNLVSLIASEFEIRVACSAKDLGDYKPMDDITPDTWNDHSNNVRVFYINHYTTGAIKSVLKTVQPELIYINGTFSIQFNLIPLLLARNKNLKIIVSPRGMLQVGALSVKPLKKKIFLRAFKFFGLHKNIRWHATDDQEKIDIQRVFGSNASIVVAANIPRRPNRFDKKRKSIGSLRLIFLSLIAEKKNLHIALEALQSIRTPITFHIYGPVKDQLYWEKCLLLIKNQIHNIDYFGPVKTLEVQNRLVEYDAMILPTKGENFGHAIYEALSVGTPAIISNYTPWGRLQDMHAGATIETFDPKDWAMTIQTFIDLGQEEYSIYSKGAYELAEDYFSKNDFKSQYQDLFSIQS